jgi:AraC-like DNA-binding protein
MSSLPYSLFTTDALPERERFAGWREDMSVIFDVENAPGSQRENEDFYATFELFHFGRSVLGGLSSSTGRYIRTQRKAARDGLDAILIQLFLEGGVQFGVGQRTTYAEAGDVVVFDLAQPVDNINREFRHLTSMWPRELIEEAVPNIASWHGRTLPRDSPVTVLLKQHMTSSFELADRFTLPEGQRVEDATLSLVKASMAGTTLPEEAVETPAMKELLAYQIKRYIRQNLGVSDLAPERIAQHFGISRRRLYQVMEPVGGISRYQMKLRLQHCLHDIQDPGQVQRTFSEIAYRWGFKHPATFNRNFKVDFGMTPGEARAQAVNALSPGSFAVIPLSDSPKTQRAREHHQWFHAIGI